MRNIRLTLAYDGTGYVGWQHQPNGISVQSVVEAGIREFSGVKASLIAAGRTDAGVHALGQVANFQTESAIPCQGFRAGLQAYLPRDVLVVDADEVPLEFHATYAAKRKRYRYVIENRRARNPFLRNYAHEYHARLDAGAMHEAAQVLVGTHDFRAFETQHPNTTSSVRSVFELTVRRFSEWMTWQTDRADRSDPALSSEGGAEEAGDFVAIDIVANGFLYNMVRTIVGTLIRVGERKWDARNVREILERGERPHAGPTAPACGLYLVRVEYDEART
ncbi:MAG TPA: tRNA pseudouridine(38-40) synthase TruA [Planctomycetaceae bacterium]|jgi:tRNA pseudouridine38-40 synthase|nr:tRNA pseudouridine(38-40) synthase TruA [Planctomycetaceae bacterium]